MSEPTESTHNPYGPFKLDGLWVRAQRIDPREVEAQAFRGGRWVGIGFDEADLYARILDEWARRWPRDHPARIEESDRWRARAAEINSLECK